MAATLHISLPDALKTFVESQAASGDYSTPSEYVQELIADDMQRRYRSLEQGLMEAHVEPRPGSSITLSADEVKGGNIVDLLRKKREEERSGGA